MTFRDPPRAWQVVSIDNTVDGIGMYPHLDPEFMPPVMYYVAFTIVIYVGGVITLLIRRIPSEGLQAMWCAPRPTSFCRAAVPPSSRPSPRVAQVCLRRVLHSRRRYGTGG